MLQLIYLYYMSYSMGIIFLSHELPCLTYLCILNVQNTLWLSGTQ